MRMIERNAHYFFILHRRVIRPPFPVLIRCPNCGHGLCKVNSDLVEISNSYGLSPAYVKAADAWQQIQHSCGATITMLWK